MVEAGSSRWVGDYVVRQTVRLRDWGCVRRREGEARKAHSQVYQLETTQIINLFFIDIE